MESKTVNEKNSLVDLINEYIDCAKYLCKSMAAYFEIKENLLVAYREGVIKKSGTFEGVNYSFHGIGCTFELEKDSIDVDFGPNGRCDGFDKMRLLNFLRNRQERFPNLNEVNLGEEFQILVDQKVIFNPQYSPGKELYYLI
jgi:hypothetical protein